MPILAASLGVAVPDLERVLRHLCRERQVVRIGDLHFHADALAMLRREVTGLKAPAGGPAAVARMDVAAFKARFAVTRKYAIPLLEYLDRERITRRVGDERIVL
jgi:selenocysteine-specific elongation factor